MYPIELLPWRVSPLERPDGRMLADIGIDQRGNALEGTDPRFRRRRRTRGGLVRLIDFIAAFTARRARKEAR